MSSNSDAQIDGALAIFRFENVLNGDVVRTAVIHEQVTSELVYEFRDAIVDTYSHAARANSSVVIGLFVVGKGMQVFLLMTHENAKGWLQQRGFQDDVDLAIYDNAFAFQAKHSCVCFHWIYVYQGATDTPIMQIAPQNFAFFALDSVSDCATFLSSVRSFASLYGREYNVDVYYVKNAKSRQDFEKVHDVAVRHGFFSAEISFLCFEATEQLYDCAMVVKGPPAASTDATDNLPCVAFAFFKAYDKSDHIKVVLQYMLVDTGEKRRGTGSKLFEIVKTVLRRRFPNQELRFQVDSKNTQNALEFWIAQGMLFDERSLVGTLVLKPESSSSSALSYEEQVQRAEVHADDDDDVNVVNAVATTEM
jgi:hypothetical protein